MSTSNLNATAKKARVSNRPLAVEKTGADGGPYLSERQWGIVREDCSA
jgi:hypothetical protein